MLLYDFVTNHSRRKPCEIFARQGSRQITLEEAAERIDRFAGALIGEGAVVGDRIGYLSKNDIDMAIMFLAAGRVGVVAVPLNYRLSATELSAIVSDAKIKLFFAQSAFLSVADAFRSEQPEVARWIATDTQDRSGWTDLESWLDSHLPLSSDHPRPDVGDVACQMYTSGTTGRAKGVMITHANYHASVSQVVSCLEHRPSLGEATLLAMPLFHAGGMQVLTLAAYLGLTLVIHAQSVTGAL
jgi:acyl-CoA synthetase (AMP-forming)/AMP-acid ligase II